VSRKTNRSFKQLTTTKMENVVVTTGNVVAVPAGAITVDEIKDSIRGGKEAQIRQQYKKSYPSQRTSNEFKDSLFSNEELGIEETEYTEERVDWIPVKKGITKVLVEKKLKEVPNACIYKVLSLKPITTSDQTRVLTNGLSGEAFESFKADNDLDKESWDKECSAILYSKIEARQLVVYGENNDQDKPADEAILFNGQRQYRQTFFSLTARADEDWRPAQINAKSDTPDMVLSTEKVTKDEQVEA
jgi:hypothetical protein